jgi:cytochrome P450
MVVVSIIFRSIEIYDPILFIITLFVAHIGHFYYTYLTRENPLPGPLPLPFVGNVLDKGFDDFVGYTERMRRKYGEMFEIYIGPKKFIMLSKYEYMQNMFDFSKNSKYLRRIPHIAGLKELDISGKGIALNHDVGVWKYNRYFLSRALLTPSFSHYAVTWSQNIVEEMIGFWKDSFNKGDYFETDLVEWAHRFTTDSITYFTTGKRIHAVEAHYNELLASRGEKPKRPSYNDTQNATEFFRNIKTFFISIYYFIVIPPWIRNYFPFLRNITKDYLKNRDWLYSYIDEIIKKRRKEIEFTPRGLALRGDMLTSMITANTDRDITEVKYDNEHMLTRPMKDEEIRAILWEAFVGGIDTVR